MSTPSAALAAIPSEVRCHVRVRGQVQGVGFRPFVFRLADDLALSGWVRNDGQGVEIEVQGTAAAVEHFVARLTREAPALSRITAVETQGRDPLRGTRGFAISASGSGPMRAAAAPDVATCSDCLGELFDPADRRYRYPFINCTQCGPRYSIIRALPYDRALTSMASFAQCPACLAEYQAPVNRRFHAEPNACPMCGPRLSLCAASGQSIEAADVIAEALARLLRGEILALKGLGGFHLACDARNGDAVARLRRRKQREEKPFAVMLANGASAGEFVALGLAERMLLESPQRPIVLLRKQPGCDAELQGAAPGLAWLGVMLPYTPLHHLMFHEALGRPAGLCWLAQPQPLCLVMTSANPAGEPLVTGNAEALARLHRIADAFVMHDREIVTRCDDSVVRSSAGVVVGAASPPRSTAEVVGAASPPRSTAEVVGAASSPRSTAEVVGAASSPRSTAEVVGAASSPRSTAEVVGAASPPRSTAEVVGAASPPRSTAEVVGAASSPRFGDRAESMPRCMQFIRRARGFTPQPIELPRAGPPVLACGPYLKNTICLTRGAQAFVSQHIGDLDNAAACAALEESVARLMDLLQVEPQIVAHDGHADFFSTRFAAAFAGERDLPALTVQHHHAHIAAVMAEHGLEGEVLGVALDGVGMGSDGGIWGGELLRAQPDRFTRIGHLRQLALPGGDKAAREPWRMAASALHAMGRNSEITQRFAARPGASAVAAMLAGGVQAPPTSSCGRWFDAAAGLAGVREVAAFEGQAAMLFEGLADRFGPAPAIEDAFVVEPEGVLDLLPLLERVAAERDQGKAAAVFHASLAAALAAWVEWGAKITGLRRVALGGGCFLNSILSGALCARLQAGGFQVFEARQVPPNDGGVSLGQAWVALNSCRERT